MQAIANKYEVETKLTGTATRAGFQSKSWINYTNLGTLAENGTVSYTLADEASLIQSIPVADSVIGKRLVWKYSNLIPNEQRQISITTQMPSVNFLGDTLVSISKIKSGFSTFSDTLKQILTGSYDPNDKLVAQGIGSKGYVLFGKELEYTVRFQNTGTDTAFRVLLRDVLSPNLDVNTFSPGFASHPYDWEIRDGNTLDVTFSPIALPDSNVNEAASHGFFSFTIQQKNNLPYGTVIENSAAIIFDFNPPIITNTVFHSIGELLVSAEEPQLFPQLWQIMNNPMKSSATFRAAEGVRGEKQFDLIDTGGRIMYSEKFYDQEFTFERGNFGSGLYFFRIVDDKGRVFSGKVVISE